MRSQKVRDINNDLSEAEALVSRARFPRLFFPPEKNFFRLRVFSENDRSPVSARREQIRRMDLEARSLPPDKKSPLLSKLREYKADLSKLKSDAKKSSSTNPDLSNRAELGLVGDHWSASSAAQRERLLATTDRINRAGDNIKQSKQTLLETEELGVSILQDLHRQRETITHARDTLHGVDDNITKSRKILSVMARRIMQNKAIMFGIIMLLVGSIGLVIYFK